jgi:hypothetical protein
MIIQRIIAGHTVPYAVTGMIAFHTTVTDATQAQQYSDRFGKLGFQCEIHHESMPIVFMAIAKRGDVRWQSN